MKRLKSSGKVSKWSTAMQAEFFDSLANLLKIGFSLIQALNFISDTDQHLSLGVTRIKEQLSTGNDFSKSVQDLIAPQAYQQLVIAEKHGQLSDVLEELARFNRLKMKQLKKIQSILVYPLFLCILLLILIGLIHLYVFPQIAQLMPSINPNPPHHVIRIINYLIVIVVGTFTGLLVYWRRQPVLKQVAWLIRVPLFGKLYQKYIAYYLASNLATLLKNGLSVKEIYMTLCRFNSGSLLFELGQQLNIAIVKGDSIKQAIRRHGFIPKEIIKFMSSGNTVPEMANSMIAYSQLMFDDMILTTNKMIGLIQPAMFLVIGITIVATYFQLLIPIYDSVKGMY
ncbi:type II secretion system protein GspF [Lentilactobacillus fungorum]|uniref:Type II secretion system protein GspF n=1 Tax=Lentilactobacillus fungorum TaxID=2201250 RepID=A0ABQ3VUT7_9LACO|nr:type II secretion system F family protein [Lentilactobacillus fungorum]GHP12648.1 type II secretion system protein GspF [Lentilactobacillus fungorum]